MKKHRILSLLLAAIMLIPANVTALAYDRTSKEPPSSTERVEQLRNSGLESLESADPIDPLEEITAIVTLETQPVVAESSAGGRQVRNRAVMLRQQTAELIFNSWSGLRIPKQALRMEKSTYTDKETGQEVQNNRLGVYALLGGRAEFKTVEVVTEGDDYYVVRSTTDESDALRAGDEVIVRATELYDGQLLEY